MSKTPNLIAYLALFLVSHNGKDYPEGATIELDETAAEPLLRAGAIALPPVRAESLQAGQLSGQKLVDGLRADLAQRDQALQAAREASADVAKAHGAEVQRLVTKAAKADADLADAKKAHAVELDAVKAQLTKAQADLAAAATKATTTAKAAPAPKAT